MKYFLASALMIISTMGYAVPYNKAKLNDNKVISELYNAYLKDIVTVRHSLEKCSHTSNEIPVEKISRLNIDKESLKTALIYYNNKANVECNHQAISNYLITATVLEIMDPSKKEIVNSSNQLLMTDYKYLAEVKPDFDALSTDIRDRLDQIDELKQPFKLIQLAEALNLLPTE